MAACGSPPTRTPTRPGRAGGGEELGAERGLEIYLQRTAVQGFKGTLDAAFGKPAQATAGT
jgi:hypothetical protein